MESETAPSSSASSTANGCSGSTAEDCTEGEGGAGAQDGGVDTCPADPLKVEPGLCGCGVEDADRDSDGSADCLDGCPADPNKTEAGTCGCGMLDEGAVNAEDCEDLCPDDPDKRLPGLCGCGVADTDMDEDSVPNCMDDCPADPAKSMLGVCGCGRPDTDSDGDSLLDCADLCPDDPDKGEPLVCGCGEPDADSDTDSVPDCIDGCVGNGTPGADETACGCGDSNADTDEDGTADCADECPDDPLKTAAGLCGCAISDVDTDLDETPDCTDECPDDADKLTPGFCGCGVAETDTDLDEVVDCEDLCPTDPEKSFPEGCGCNVVDADTDSDGVLDCNDLCPSDPLKDAPASCGCGSPDTEDTTGALECENLESALLHRYSFTGAGTTALDSVGTADGIITGATLPDNGTLVLAADQYVDLPNDIIAGVVDVSFEVWFNRTASGNWQRLFDFGDNDNAVEGEQGVGTSYIFLTPRTSTTATTSNVLRLTFKPVGGAETVVNATAAIDTNVPSHLAGIFNDTEDTMSLYLNGALVDSVAWTGALSQVSMLNNWLGRSQYAVDADFIGVLDELRIYDVALTAEQVQYSFEQGGNPPYLAP